MMNGRDPMATPTKLWVICDLLAKYCTTNLAKAPGFPKSPARAFCPRCGDRVPPVWGDPPTPASSGHGLHPLFTRQPQLRLPGAQVLEQSKPEDAYSDDLEHYFHFRLPVWSDQDYRKACHSLLRGCDFLIFPLGLPL